MKEVNFNNYVYQIEIPDISPEAVCATQDLVNEISKRTKLGPEGTLHLKRESLDFDLSHSISEASTAQELFDLIIASKTIPIHREGPFTALSIVKSPIPQPEPVAEFPGLASGSDPLHGLDHAAYTRIFRKLLDNQSDASLRRVREYLLLQKPESCEQTDEEYIKGLAVLTSLRLLSSSASSRSCTTL